MTCEERKDLLLLYAAGALEPDELASLRAHLATGCPTCIGALAEADAVVHALPSALPREAPPESAWQNLQQRLDLHAELHEELETPQPPSFAFPQNPPASRARYLGWAAAACVALVLGLLLQNTRTELASTRSQLANLSSAATQSQQELLSRVQVLQADVDRLRKDREGALLVNDSLKKDFQVQLAALARADRFAIAGGEQKEARGAVFWNRAENRWTVYATNLQPAQPGKVLELWAITQSGEKIAVGSATPDSAGNAVWNITLPATKDPITIAAVTDEPAGPQVKVPTGQVQFLSQLATNTP